MKRNNLDYNHEFDSERVCRIWEWWRARLLGSIKLPFFS